MGDLTALQLVDIALSGSSTAQVGFEHLFQLLLERLRRAGQAEAVGSNPLPNPIFINLLKYGIKLSLF